MTESGIFTFNAVLLIAIAIGCAATGQWLGLLGSLIGAVNAVCARSYLVKWKPEAALE